MQAQAMHYLAPVGRLLVAGVFLASGVNKIVQWPAIEQLLVDRGLPAAPLLLSVATALELIGGASILLGLYARAGGLALLLFLVPVTLIVHDFWSYEGAERAQELVNFLKNASIAGGVVLVVAYGAGPCSVDRLLTPKARKRPESVLSDAGQSSSSLGPP